MSTHQFFCFSAVEDATVTVTVNEPSGTCCIPYVWSFSSSEDKINPNAGKKINLSGRYIFREAPDNSFLGVSANVVHSILLMDAWRRGWDSNPRGIFQPTAFRERHHKPLDHLSPTELINYTSYKTLWSCALYACPLCSMIALHWSGSSLFYVLSSSCSQEQRQFGMGMLLPRRRVWDGSG